LDHLRPLELYVDAAPVAVKQCMAAYGFLTAARFFRVKREGVLK
jgi:hypothetical protein